MENTMSDKLKKAIKVALSIAALIAGAVTTAMTGGMFDVSPAVIAVVTAGAALFGYLGISPIVLSAPLSRLLGGVCVFLTALTGWHASVVSRLANPHPWIWHIVGVVAILVGVLSRGPLNPSPPPIQPNP